jgi:hypothetical protein
MKKLTVSHVLLILFATTIVSVQASMEIQAIVDQSVHVIFDVKSIDPEIYTEIVNASLLSVSTLPESINEVFEQKNWASARCDYDSAQEIFSDSTESIHVEFYLGGSDVLNSTMNAVRMTRTYYVRTDWREFRLNLTLDISVDFAEIFATPVSSWDQINYTLGGKQHPAYNYTSGTPSQIDPSFYFVLPEKATNVHTIGDTIIFDAPYSLEEALLNSPFLILFAVIIIVVVAALYRRIRR